MLTTIHMEKSFFLILFFYSQFVSIHKIFTSLSETLCYICSMYMLYVFTIPIPHGNISVQK